jgi:phosphatidylglycerol:prolipoprotein diacylglycerol transferase
LYPVLLELGGFQLRAYGVAIAAALLIGAYTAMREAHRKGIAPERIPDFALWAVGFGLIGARLYYLALFSPEVFIRAPLQVLALWSGGLAIHGGLIAAFVAMMWFTWRHGIPFWRFADALAPGVILGQALGRVGCFLNGDAYGIPSALPWAVTFSDPNALAPLNVALHPTQLYEMALNLGLFALLWGERRYIRFDGQILLFYVAGYGLIRFIVEDFRGDPLQFAGTISAAQTLSVLLVVGAAVVLAYRVRLASTAARR